MEPNVSEDDLKRAYRKAAMKWHPDKNISNVKPAEDKFKEIQQAYDTLRDPRSREGYDHMLMNPVRLRLPFPRSTPLNINLVGCSEESSAEIKYRLQHRPQEVGVARWWGRWRVRRATSADA